MSDEDVAKWPVAVSMARLKTTDVHSLGAGAVGNAFCHENESDDFTAPPIAPSNRVSSTHRPKKGTDF